MSALTRLLRRPARSSRPVVPTHQPVVGLDIGSSAIKVAEIQRTGKAWQLLHCGIQPLPPEAVVDGQIKQAEVVTQAIRELLATTGITTRQTALSLGGSSIITKKIQTASMTELDLEDQIALEAEEYIPFDIDEVNLDFQILGQTGETMDVLLTACKKELILGHTEVIRQAGLDPQVCDLDLFCLINACQTLLQTGPTPAPTGPTPNPAAGAIALVNIGTTFLNMAIMTPDGLPGYIRDHSLGCRQIIHEIKTRGDLGWTEAEQRLIMPEQQGGHHSDPLAIQTEIVLPFLEQVAQQIRQAVGFHKTGHPDQPVTLICLSGGGALLPNAATAIQEHLGLPTRVAEPFANLTYRPRRGKPQNTSLEQLHPVAPRFMVALGLALRGEKR
ncbi:MAG: pilus assembly protein PilM [Magnetococcus sp. DMHC-8]